MTVQRVCAAQAAAQLGTFSAVIDARSEDEFALDHLPQAVNWPTLNNAERRLVGTMYVQVHPFEASKRGAAMAARNIARHIERELLETPKSWKPLIYCWRGGKRSGALALVLDQIGFRVTVVEGGYQAFRQAVLQGTPALARGLHYRVVCGPTGSGKTRLLQALQRAGAQVLDLEALACHRSSVLGLLPGVAQPSQKRFETLVWTALQQFDPKRVVFIESESKKVGNLAVPAALIDAMRASACLDLHLPLEERVQLLLEDYPHFSQDATLFCERLEALTELRGKALVALWKALVQAGQQRQVVLQLLQLHYDPGYERSMQRNFAGYGLAPRVTLNDRSVAQFDALAHALRAEFEAMPPRPV